MIYFWTLRMISDDGGDDEVEFYDNPTSQEIEETCRDYVQGYSGFDPAGERIHVSWWLSNPDGEEVDHGQECIDIEPNHKVLISEAILGSSSRSCGDDHDDHDWTSEGEGGCDSNPGVWATGGTSMQFSSHCRKCGLQKTESTTGWQYNDGEKDEIEYYMPDEWCSHCESDSHDWDECKHNEDNEDDEDE